MNKSYLIKPFLFLLISCFSIKSFAQPAWTFDILGKEKKEEKYEEKILASEKTGTKKFGARRRFIQNSVSHYNFFFNANNGINKVLELAKIAQKDDYTKLLSFYPYTLDNAAAQKLELDSVIYRCTAGILLHDLRTEWVDNFYLLMGKAYFLRKDFDSAGLTFQFINYNLFPRKKKNDDDTKIVGSNEAQTGQGSVSIANKENNKFVNKLLTRPPSRNDALIWLTRNFIEKNELGDAAGLISILKNDPNLPKRLQNDLHEVEAYWYYVQNMYDSAAVHLEDAISNADNKEDKSRAQFLLAQLYETTSNFEKAETYYEKVSKNTTNILMDIYARLNSAKMLRTNANAKDLQASIDKLLKMAHKDKFDAYKDILYYSAGQLTLQLPDTLAAISLFKKSIDKNLSATPYREKAYLQLANIAYNAKSYEVAYNNYDSLGANISNLDMDSATIAERKEILSRLIPKIKSVNLQDSLQQLALLPLTEREKIIKQIVKKYNKEKGIKETEAEAYDPITFTNTKNAAAPDLFKNSSNSSGLWYFYNAGLKGKGVNEFKQKWGKRTNIDNWRRKAATAANTPKNNIDNLGNNLSPDGNLNGDPNAQPADKKNFDAVKAEQDFTFEGLMGNVPLTKELLDSSNKIIVDNLFEAAQIFQNELQDYIQAINYYERLISLDPNYISASTVYAGLSYCYNKIGDISKSNFYKNILKTRYADSKENKASENPQGANKLDLKATSSYEKIYELFATGNFAQALADKKQADSIYGKGFWSPQLLYIEAVGYIKDNKDSMAIISLTELVSLYPTASLKPKATTLLEMLNKKQLAQQQLKASDTTKAVIVNMAKTTTDVKKTDTASATPKVIKNNPYKLTNAEAHSVVMIFNNVDAKLINDAKTALNNYNKKNAKYKQTTINNDAIDVQKSILVFDAFTNIDNALAYFDNIAAAAPKEIAWLPKEKYSFIIISKTNLQLLKNNKDLKSYLELLKANFSTRF